MKNNDFSKWTFFISTTCSFQRKLAFFLSLTCVISKIECISLWHPVEPKDAFRGWIVMLVIIDVELFDCCIGWWSGEGIEPPFTLGRRSIGSLIVFSRRDVTPPRVPARGSCGGIWKPGGPNAVEPGPLQRQANTNK